MLNKNPGNPLVRSAVRAVLAGGALAATFGMAHAQNSPANSTSSSTAPAAASQLKEVVVTGSLIATPNQVSMSPVTFVSAQAIQQTGATRIEDMLNQLPQVFAAQGSNIINGGLGIATVDLRDLGSNRTLVLVDGQRLQPGDPRTGGAADLDMIPTALVSSVQIQTGGASSIYGADAVAGVVNFRLKQHFQGVELVFNGGIYQNDNTNTGGVQSVITNYNATYGTHFAQAPSTVWEGAQKEIDFIAGFNTPDGKGNATFYATYRSINAAMQSKYSVSACSLGSGYVAGSYDTGGKFTCIGSSNGYPGRFLNFLPNATTPPVGCTNYPGTMVCDQTVNLATGQLQPWSPAEDFNFGPLNYFQRPDERYTAGDFLHYTFNRHVTVYANSMFMDDHALLQIAPSAAFLGTPYTVNCSNPFLSPSMVSAWCGGLTTGSYTQYIGRRNVEGGNRVDNLSHLDFREVIGAKGEINDNWSYNGSFQYGFTQLSETYLNDLSVTRINDALDVVMGPNGPECQVTANGVTNGLGVGCVPWNIFGHGGSAYMAPSAAVKFLSTPAVQRGKITQTIVKMVLNGDLSQYVTLPTAHSGLQVAVGADYRDDKSFTSPDMEFQTGDLSGQGGAQLPVAGDVIVREGFGEARLPLVQDKPFVKSLTIDGSYRFSAYSPFNGSAKGVNTNTFGFSAAWKPSHDYRIRASFDRAVRAPNVGELYSAQTVSLDGTIDPCAGANPSASLAACERAGVPANLYGAVPPAPASQYNGLQGGNPGLQPETALTSSFGIGWTPSYIPGLSAEIDYYDIKIENVIESLGGNTIVTQCVNNGNLCQDMHRSSAGALWGQSGYVIDTLQNVGQLQEKGVDIDVNYDVGLHKYGRLAVSLKGTYIGGFYTTTIAGDPSTRYDCAGYYGPLCGEPVPKYRQRMSVTWMTPWHGLDATAIWRYLSPVTIDQLSPNPALGLLSSGGTIANGAISNTDAHLSSYSYLDLTVGMPLGHGVSARLGVNNVLDKQPPLVGLSDLPAVVGNGNTFPQMYDAMGRYIFAMVTAKF